MADKKKSNERSGGVNIGSGAIKKGRSGGVNIGSGAKVKVGGEIVQQDKIVRANVVHATF